jgi:hypothetical protein
MDDNEDRSPARANGASIGDQRDCREVISRQNSEQRTRRLLPNRRAAETLTYEHGGASFTMTAGRYADGTIGELFINSDHVNSAMDAIASDAAIAVSFALQFGANIDAIKAAMKRNSAGEPSSPIGAALDRIVP